VQASTGMDGCSCALRGAQPSAGALALSAQLSDDGSEVLVTLNLPCQLLGSTARCAPGMRLRRTALCARICACPLCLVQTHLMSSVRSSSALARANLPWHRAAPGCLVGHVVTTHHSLMYCSSAA